MSSCGTVLRAPHAPLRGVNGFALDVVVHGGA